MVQLWGIGDHHRRLHLPECYSLNLYRSDDLEWLEVHAPKLRSLNLQACYSCEHVCLFPKEGPEVSVNYVNANIGTKSLKHLAQHPHVGTENMHGSNDDDDDIGGMLGDYRPPNMAGMNMAGMTGGAMAELFGNMMGNPGVGPGMGGDYPGDSDEEEDDDESEGAAPDVQDAYLIQLFAMMQQAGSIPPGLSIGCDTLTRACATGIGLAHTRRSVHIWPLLLSFPKRFSLESLFDLKHHQSCLQATDLMVQQMRKTRRRRTMKKRRRK